MPITYGCEPPCGCWELNSRPLEEQSMLSTAEPSLQSLKGNLKKNKIKDPPFMELRRWCSG
jgi:E3 ubiquitin-protein ligase NEDD4